MAIDTFHSGELLGRIIISMTAIAAAWGSTGGVLKKVGPANNAIQLISTSKYTIVISGGLSILHREP